MTKPASQFASCGTEVRAIPVSLSYDIIRLFSEGLYRSPHKAIEELVSNSYDAGARTVHILLPDPEDKEDPLTPLWVIDDGRGMDERGFQRLWRVADSDKNDAPPANGRLPIGQFGIGKLAAYVLAWRLIHISRVEARFLLTVMDFRTVTQRQADIPKPATVSLRDIDVSEAQVLLSDVEERDSRAWELLFGRNQSGRSWTVAGLTDFRSLYERLTVGRLRWVLSTGLPLHSDFRVHLDGDPVVPSKVHTKPIWSGAVRSALPGLGLVEGTAGIYEKPLTSGKSAAIGRSHGFFCPRT